MPTKLFWRFGFVIHLGLVLVIEVTAYLGILPPIYMGLLHADLAGHMVLIGLLAFFLDGALGFKSLLPGKLSFVRLAPVILLILAGTEEAAQMLSPWRTACLPDFAADAAGIVLFSGLARLWHKCSMLTKEPESRKTGRRYASRRPALQDHLGQTG